MASLMDDLLSENLNGVSDEQVASPDVLLMEEESVEQLIQRAEDQFKRFIESRSSQVTTDEGSSQNSIINGIMVESYVSSTLNEAQATLDSIRANATVTIPLQGANSNSDPIVIDSDDDDISFVHRAIPEVVDLCSPTIPLPRRELPNNENSASGHSNTLHKVSTVPDVEKPNRVLCPICMEASVQPHSTRCGHIYCGSCIKQSFRVNKKCPLCNKVLKLSEIHPVYI